jgi:leader peptidase (prepilin peptidase) / N-methyltransferase
MLLAFILFFLGLCAGSFLNAFLWRYQTKQSLGGRSMCPNCKHQIAWYDNMPVLSYLILRGKCRHCKKPISMQYPVVELLTAIAFLLVGLFSNPGKILGTWLNVISTSSLVIPTAVEGSLKGFLGFARNDMLLVLNVLMLSILLLVTSTLILIAVYDFKTKEIPNGFNLAFITTSLIYISSFQLLTNSYQLLIFLNNLLPYLLSGIVAFLFFYTFVYFSKETWMGGGDAKLAFGMGILLGPWNTLIAIIIASWSGAVYGLTMIGLARIKNQEVQKSREVLDSARTIKNLAPKTSHLSSSHEVPFGPFLALGTIISLLFGSQIVAWYARIFLGF